MRTPTLSIMKRVEIAASCQRFLGRDRRYVECVQPAATRGKKEVAVCAPDLHAERTLYGCNGIFGRCSSPFDRKLSIHGRELINLRNGPRSALTSPRDSIVHAKATASRSCASAAVS